jgi:non-ribosomal peptide synthetase component F
MPFTLHQLLTETAARQPDHEAVRLREERITYAELERARNQLAHALIDPSADKDRAPKSGQGHPGGERRALRG